jgi:hypothetical protein
VSESDGLLEQLKAIPATIRTRILH